MRQGTEMGASLEHAKAAIREWAVACALKESVTNLFYGVVIRTGRQFANASHPPAPHPPSPATIQLPLSVSRRSTGSFPLPSLARCDMYVMHSLGLFVVPSENVPPIEGGLSAAPPWEESP